MEKSKKYKALIFDVDDTCVKLGLQNLPSEKVRNAIKALIARGIPVSAATGRAPNELQLVIQALDLKDPCILANGAIIYDPAEKKVLEETPIPREIIERTIKILEKYLDRFFFYTLEGEIKYSPQNLDKKVFSCYLVPIKPGDAEDLVKQLQAIPEITAHWTEKTWQGPGWAFLTFNNVLATKQRALSHLFQRLQIKPEEIVAVGDGENDLPMIIAAGMGVAMGNAAEGLKTVADFIAPTVDEDGLAYVIEKFFPAG